MSGTFESTFERIYEVAHARNVLRWAQVEERHKPKIKGPDGRKNRPSPKWERVRAVLVLAGEDYLTSREIAERAGLTNCGARMHLRRRRALLDVRGICRWAKWRLKQVSA